MSKFQKLVLVLLVFILTFSVVAAGPNIRKITASINDSLKITIDGEAFIPKDAKGNVMQPITYNGSTYLPARAIAEAAGMDVAYDDSTYTVQLSTKKTYVGNPLPDSDWKAGTDLPLVSNLTFINTDTTNYSMSDNYIKQTFNRYMDAISKGLLEPGSEASGWFIADSPDINDFYELSSAMKLAKDYGVEARVFVNNVKIASLGYTDTQYAIAKKNLAEGVYSAVVVEADFYSEVDGKKDGGHDYFMMIMDEADSTWKLYGVVRVQ